MTSAEVKTSDLLLEYKKLTRDDSADNVATGKLRMQHHYTFLLSEANNYVVERTKYGKFKANQRSYLLPKDYQKMKAIRYENASGIWIPLIEIKSVEQWHLITMSVRTSDTPVYYIILNEQGNLHFEIDSIPATNGEDDSLEIVYEGYQDPLSFPDDYTDGTVAVEQGEATVTGTLTTFTDEMVGRFFKPDNSKFWYDIKSKGSTTVLALVNYYQETTGSGLDYTIAEIPRLPAEFHYTPLWGAVSDYYLPTNEAKSKLFEARYTRELLILQAKYKNKTTGNVTPGKRVGTTGIRLPYNYPHTELTQI